MKIEKMSYSRSPWRLLDSDGREIQVRYSMDHPELGHTVVTGSICGETKAECIDKALALLESLLKRGQNGRD